MVMSRIMRRVAVLMVGGVCVGLALTVALKKVLAAAGAVHANHDFAFLAALTAVWIATGVLASVAPAQRAASIDPIKALRIE